MDTAQDLAAGSNRAFWHETKTSASREAIWRLWTDPSTWKDWDKGLKDARMNGAMRCGAKGKIIPLSGPSSGFEVTTFDAGKRYAFATNLPFAKLTVTRVFLDDTATVFRHDVTFSGPLGGFWAARFGPAFRAALPPTMEALARFAEREGACT